MSFSADGKRLVYVEGMGTIHLMKAAFDPVKPAVAGEATAITEGAVLDYHASVSPDGGWIVFLRRTTGQEDLFVVRSDGTDCRRITSDEHKERGPRWAPTGDQIAFISDHGESYEIWSVRPDGSGLRQLTDAPGIRHAAPVWSPDGKRLAVSDFKNRVAYVVDLSLEPGDREPQQLPPINDEIPGVIVTAWSPDGSRLACSGCDAEGAQKGVFLYSLQSGEYRRIRELGAMPHWLSDNRRLIMWSDRSVFDEEAVGSSLVLLDPETGAETLLELPAQGWLFDFTLSNDDRWIYFSCGEAQADLWLIELE
jgi:Tol biopolymer transport system component